MILLIGFAFLAGVVTILSPCILPVLPIILSSSLAGKDTGKSRPIGVVVGFVLSFTFFTLFLSTLVRLSGISADTLRTLSVIVIAGFGLSLLIPQFQVRMEQWFSGIASRMPKGNANKPGFWSGVLVGLSLGLLWTPCVGPILASVISLALVGSVNLGAFLITLAYSLGTAIPMFAIMIGGQKLLTKVPWLLKNSAYIQKMFGIIMILTAVAIFTNQDRKFQVYILDTFPQYGAGITQIEDNEAIRNQLDALDSSNEGIDTDSGKGEPMFDTKQVKGPKAPELIPGGKWYNTEPLTLEELQGKVVLIDFWTYTCINCQRTLPYLRDWWEKYEDDGLVIIGVHAPEFEFEKDPDNVAQAIQDFQLAYPVVQDNEFKTWRAYKNRYWPAKYLLDKDGIIRYTHFGEGKYDETEQIIQKLLNEEAEEKVSDSINNPDYDIYSKTHETYLGYGRLENVASPEPILADAVSTYSPPDQLANNKVAFEGDWLFAKEYAQPQNNAKLFLNFESKEVFLVMNPIDSNSTVRVLVDGKEQYFGEDNKSGIVTVTTDDLYKLVNLEEPGRHMLELQFPDGNIQLFAFTFG